MTHKTGSPDFVITRLIDAPRETVWKAWTDPVKLSQWWGPKGCTIRQAAMDLRPGGMFHYCMDFAGQEMWGKYVYREIKAPERMVWVNSFSDPRGGVTGHPLAPEWPKEILTTVTLEEENGKTKVTVRWSPLSPTADQQRVFDESHDKMRGGWGGTFERMDNYFSGKGPVIVERVFNAPAEKVWKALTAKEEMKKWYFDLPDFRPEVGAEFRFIAGDDTKKYVHLCRVTEVLPGKKIAYTWRYEGYAGDSLVSFELFPEGNKTRLRVTHEGLETFPKSNPDLAKENFAEGWTSIIGDSLKKYLEK